MEAVTAVEHLERSRAYHTFHAGKTIEKIYSAAAQRELDEFVHILEAEGVTVRRPDPLDHARPLVTPHWTSPGGNCPSSNHAHLSSPQDDGANSDPTLGPAPPRSAEG